MCIWGMYWGFLYLFFSFYFRYIISLYIGLVTTWHTLYLYLVYIYIYIYIDVCYSPIFSCVVSFLSLNTCFLYDVCNLIFLFHTKMPWRVLFKMFQKYRLSKSFLPRTLFLQSFSRVCVRIYFIVFSKWVWVEWSMISLIYSFVYCGFVTDFQMGRLLGHMWFNVGNICQYFM